MSKEEMNERYMATAKSDGTLDVKWIENRLVDIENRLVDIVAKKCYAPSTDQVERERNNKGARCGEECRESSISSALDLILEELRELRRVQRDGVAGTDLLRDAND